MNVSCPTFAHVSDYYFDKKKVSTYTCDRKIFANQSVQQLKTVTKCLIEKVRVRHNWQGKC